MIHFIICNDDEKYLKKTQKIINDFMIQYDVNYKCYKFTSYNEELEKVAKTNLGFKVYFLEYKIGNETGMQFAEKIREEYDDWCSFIVLTSNFDKIPKFHSSRFYLLDFINSKISFEKSIQSNLNHIMKAYGGRPHCLTFEYNHMVYRIPLNQILTIEKEKDAKRCLITTEYDQCVIPKNLTEAYIMLDQSFFKTSRSMVVNLNKIKSYDVVNNRITFLNNSVTHDISRENKKTLLQLVKEAR